MPTHPIDLLIGARLRELRRLKKFSQQSLAREVGITGQQLQKYEMGRNRLSISRFVGLCEALQVRASTILRECCEPAEPVTPMPGQRHAQAAPSLSAELLYYYEQLPNESAKRALNHLCKEMAGANRP